MTMRVAFQGEVGAYSHLAAQELLGADMEVVPCVSFDDVFSAVEEARVDRGIVPIENSLGGTIHRNYDLLLRHALNIVAEHSLQISHCLIGRPESRLENVRIVRSHPQALAQCEHRLRAMGVKEEVAYDTAGSVKELAGTDRPDVAALASRLAAQVYGMKILQHDMQDHANNHTRFLVLAREASGATPSGLAKASVAFSLKNVPGALFKALAVFALRDIDLTKLESRPIPGQTWNYMFYLDFVTDDFAGRGQRAIEHLKEISVMLRVLGVYRSAL